MAEEDIKVISNKWHEKYNKGFMLFGGISSEGLLPRDKPVFFTEWLHNKCEEIGKEKKTWIIIICWILKKNLCK